MTPDEKAENVALLAERVMGWTSRVDDNGILWWARIDGTLLIDGDWDPYVSIADAMEMLEQIGTWILRRDGETYTCGLICMARGRESLLDAICAACLEWARARGEKNA